MTDTTIPATTDTTVKTKVTEVEKLAAAAVKVARSFVKIPFSDSELESLFDIGNLILSTVTHAKAVKTVAK